MIAAGEALDLGRVLLDLLVVLVAARLAAELAERIRVPAVLGEIVVGILVGPSVLGWIDTANGDTAAMLLLLGEIGVLLLLLQVGMEMDLAELAKVGRAALFVAVIGVSIPFAGGALGAWSMGEAGKTAIFLGAALTATSVGITARVLGDLRALATKEARVVLGAAVADDVLGLVILTVVVKVVTEGSVGVGTVAETIGLAAGFLVVTGLIAVFVVPRALDLVHRYARGAGALLVATFVLMLGFAELADLAKLAFIIGAFMAGLGVGRSRHAHHIEDGVLSISRVFVPVFFVGIGINADLEAMARPSVLGLAAVLTTVGIVGKVAAGWGATGTGSNRLMIGIGMIPRGEVGLIFASIGLSRGVLDDDLYGALLIMVLVTTVVAPPLLRWRIQQVGLVPEPGTTTAAALAAIAAGDRSARRDLSRAADLADTAPALAALVDDLRSDELGTGREVPFPRLDALLDAGDDDPTLRAAATVLDIAAAAGDGTIQTVASLVSDDAAIRRVAAAAAAMLDVSVSPDGISDAEIARVGALVTDPSDVAAAVRIALLTPDLEPQRRAAIETIGDSLRRR